MTYSHSKRSQELKWKIVLFLPDYAHAKMNSRKREGYTTYDESKIIKKLLVTIKISSWLPPGLDRRKVCSQEQSN